MSLLISLDPKAWDSGCRKAGTVGESTQAADLGHGLWGLCGGHPGQLHLSLLVCRWGRVGLREVNSPARVGLLGLKYWTLPSLKINVFPFYLDQSNLRVKSFLACRYPSPLFKADLSDLFCWTWPLGTWSLVFLPKQSNVLFVSQAGDPALSFPLSPPWQTSTHASKP